MLFFFSLSLGAVTKQNRYSNFVCLGTNEHNARSDGVTANLRKMAIFVILMRGFPAANDPSVSNRLAQNWYMPVTASMPERGVGSTELANSVAGEDAYAGQPLANLVAHGGANSQLHNSGDVAW